MLFELKLNSIAVRLGVLLAALAISALLFVLVISNFITGTLADDRVAVSRDLLVSALRYFPNSGRLQGRLADAELLEQNRDLAGARAAAQKAIELSPFDYSHRLSLAAISEAEGNRAAAEAALNEAVKLAPNNIDVHWRLANVLLREGKFEESLGQFRIATSANDSLLAGTLDLVWRVSGGNSRAVDAVTSSDPKHRLMLARFLLKMRRLPESAEVFRGLSRNAQLGNTESGAFLNELILAGGLNVARSLWMDLRIADPSQVPPGSMWNGGFESDILRDFSQFDWTIGRSEFARLSVDTSSPHSGVRSLRVDFIGRDTTRLNSEMRQMVVVLPGVRYQLECYAKSSGLITPEAPRIVVTDRGTKELGASSPLPSGSTDWERVVVEFTAPAVAEGGSAVYVTLQRTPRYAYDEPTRGTLWLDDFVMSRK